MARSQSRIAASVFAIAAPMCALICAGAAGASPRLIPDGPSTTLLTNDQRAMLGIKFGPDTPIAFFQAKNGRYYINSAGSLGPQRGPSHPAAWNLHVDSQLTRILALNSDAPASGPQDVQTIMTIQEQKCGRGTNRVRATDPAGAECAALFDRDYAGGGAYYRCPDNQTSAYFYHGENHTAPSGELGPGGWFGIGVGTFNADETEVSRAHALSLPGGGSTAQITGVNLPTIWTIDAAGQATPPQAHPFNDVPTIVPGSDGYLYLYEGNATEDPAYNPAACKPGCVSVSRAPIAAFCSTIKTASPVKWQNYYRGGWGQPAVNDAHSPMGLGSGGAFTPLFAASQNGEFGGTVMYLPVPRIYVMVRVRHGGIVVRYSNDGLNFTDSEPMVPQPTETTPYGDEARLLYPEVNVLPGPHYILTYVTATKGHFWKWAQLMRQNLTFAH